MVNINTLDLNLLRVLDALLREGSTVGAAERVGLSQPAVSAALSRLRLSLGDELFIRAGRGLEPTDYARAIALPLHEALERIETLLEAPQIFDPTTASASFRLSGSDFFAEMLMPRLAEAVSRDAPGIRVQLVDLVPDSYVETLRRYEVDMALIPDMDLPDWAEKRPVFRSGFTAVARRDNPALAELSDDTEIPMDLFCELGHVLFSPEGRTSAMGDAALAAVGRKRRVVMTLPVFSGVWRAVSESDLIALLPDQLARRIAPRAGLKLLRPPMAVPVVQIVMVWPRRARANPGHRWLRDKVADTLLPLNDGYPPPGGAAT